jgi:hypothetical protein
MEPPPGDDPQAWLVYADWLQARPEPHLRALGEAIVLDAAGRGAEVDHATHTAAWLGALAGDANIRWADWRGGFPRVLSCTLSATDPAAELARLLDHLMAARLEVLEVQTWYEDGVDLAPMIARLTARGPRALATLTIVNATSYGSAWRSVPGRIGAVGPLAAAFALEQLTLEGEGLSLAGLAAPRLRALDLSTVGTAALRELAVADLPALAALRLMIGPESFPPPPDWRDAAGVLPGVVARLPALRELSLGTEFDIIEPLLAVLPELALPQLEALDLIWLPLGDRHLPLLERLAPALAHIPAVRISQRGIQNRAAIPALGKSVRGHRNPG